MKRWMYVFGILDLGILLTYAPRVPGYLRDLQSQPILNTACLLMMASLAVSGVALLFGRQWVLYVNYMQFPARILLAFLSFSWLAFLLLPTQASVMQHQAVWVPVVALEGIRLGITVMLHLGLRGHQPGSTINSNVAAL